VSKQRPTLTLKPKDLPPVPPAVATPSVDMTPAPLRFEDLEPSDPEYAEALAAIETERKALEAAEAEVTAIAKAKADAKVKFEADSGVPVQFQTLLQERPLPWIRGPYGDIWCEAGVETYDPDTEAGYSKIPGVGGTYWRATIERDSNAPKPLMVMENPGEAAHKDAADFIVWAVNRAAK
jgi:hypothetical protein